MTRLVVFVVFLAALISAAVWFANEPGEVTLLWRGWRMDTSVGILLALMAVTVLLMLGAAKVIALIRGGAAAFAQARKERRMKQGLVALGHGFAAVYGGQPALARKLAKDAAALLDDNAATRLLRIRAAAVNDDGPALRTEAAHLLDAVETELSALRELAARAVKEGDVVGALNYAKRALGRKDAPRWALETVLDVQVANGRWADALGALDSKVGRDHFSAATHQRLRGELLTRMADEALGHGDANAAEAYSRKALDAGAGERAVIAHARALAAQGKGKKAMAEIEKAWRRHPGQGLLRAYLSAAAGESALDQARRVEKLVADNADHAESRLALAEVSLKAQLWGQARNRLSPLLGDDVSKPIQTRAALLMAELEAAERNDAAAGASWLRRALESGGQDGAFAPAARTVSDLIAAAS
jgi:HemY protein